jgi:hypothetical protein
LEECTASIYRVNELVQADAEVIQRKKCVNYNRGQFEGIYQSQVWKVRRGGGGYGIVSSQWQLETVKVSTRTALPGLH